MTIEKDIYQDHKNYIDNGYKNRSEYLKHLSEYFMIPHASVCAIAEVLGTGEDFDPEDYPDLESIENSKRMIPTKSGSFIISQ